MRLRSWPMVESGQPFHKIRRAAISFKDSNIRHKFWKAWIDVQKRKDEEIKKLNRV